MSFESWETAFLITAKNSGSFGSGNSSDANSCRAWMVFRTKELMDTPVLPVISSKRAWSSGSNRIVTAFLLSPLFLPFSIDWFFSLPKNFTPHVSMIEPKKIVIKKFYSLREKINISIWLGCLPSISATFTVFRALDSMDFFNPPFNVCHILSDFLIFWWRVSDWTTQTINGSCSQKMSLHLASIFITLFIISK